MRRAAGGAGRRRGAAAAAMLARVAACVVLAWKAAGCGAAAPDGAGGGPARPEAAPPAAAPAPAMTLRVASLDLSGFAGRIGPAEVKELADQVAGRKIDLLALQGVVRYPTLASRTDLLDALAEATGMRNAFGETVNVSGRVTGNGVLSAYPISSSDATAYEGLSGSGFEGALRVIVDAGTRPVVVVSTRLPDPLGAADARIVAGTLSALAAEGGGDPLLILGNLPGAPAGGPWTEARGGPGRLWFTPRGIAVSEPAGSGTRLGRLLVADVHLYPRSGP